MSGDIFPRVRPVGDRALTIQMGSALDPETTARVRALDARVSEARLQGVLESVPTYAALLVIYDPGRARYKDLKGALLALAAKGGEESAPGEMFEIETVYDGEDLDEIAQRSSMSRDDVVALHTSRVYSVLMLGFSPGFAYMGFVDDLLKAPRRTTPRPRVPSGSVAIASAQTGVYPRSLPGGWNLLGRTHERLFDAEAPRPSRLMPGDRVRFLPVEKLAPAEPRSPWRFSSAGVRVIEPGVLTMVQDGGRRGMRRIAVPFAGFSDPKAARRANALVGNEPDAPLLEVCGPPLRLEFDTRTFAALVGGTFEACVERVDLDGGRMAFPPDAAVRLRPGNAVVIREISSGMRVFLAIGGLQVPKVLGSSSTDLASGFLRPLSQGDTLAIEHVDADRVIREKAAKQETGTVEIRVVMGPQDDHFDDAAIEAFFATVWRAGLDSDRVGVRLDGITIEHRGPKEIVSDGMVPGCIQIPPDGRPIVMLADCPTTGGYPKIACVVEEDLGRLAQARPRETVIRFRRVTIEEMAR